MANKELLKYLGTLKKRGLEVESCVGSGSHSQVMDNGHTIATVGRNAKHHRSVINFTERRITEYFQKKSA